MAGALERASHGNSAMQSLCVNLSLSPACAASATPNGSPPRLVGIMEKKGGRSAWLARLSAPRTAILPCGTRRGAQRRGESPWFPGGGSGNGSAPFFIGHQHKNDFFLEQCQVLCILFGADGRLLPKHHRCG